MTTNTTSPLARVGRHSVTITSLVATLAAGVAGCNSTMSRQEAAGVGTAGRASVQVDAGATQGRFQPSYYETQVREFGAPREWAENAGSMVTAVEAQRASAEATRVRAAADRAAALAEANRLLAEAVSAFEREQASSRRVRESADAGYAAQESEAKARKAAFEAEAQAKLAEAEATLDGAIRRAAAMREEAERAYALAEAAYERRIAEATGEQSRTRITIEQMRSSAGAVKSRGEAEAAALRQEAAARRALGQAQAGAHEAEIEAARSWMRTAYEESQRELAALQAQTAAEVASIRAEAAQIENWELDERYSSAIASANAEHDTAMARAKALRDGATNELTAAAARFTTDRKDLELRLADAGLAYEAELARIDSDTKVIEARAAIGMARAQELEHDAKARFIGILAEAVGGETQAERSQAFAWAQGFADDVKASGAAPAGLNLDSPEIVGGINAFIGQLAEARQLRVDAERARESAKTAAIMRRSQIEVWWTESRAAAEAALEGIAQAETEKVEVLRQRFADADEIESRGRIAFEQASGEADCAKREAMAMLEELRQREAFAERSGENRAAALAARSVALREEGKERVARLTGLANSVLAASDAAAEWLEAQASQVMARAETDASTWEAMASVAVASLESEYEIKASSAVRDLSVARADYEEALSVADSVVSMAEVSRAETIASIELERASFARESAAALAAARSRRDEAMAAAEQMLARATAEYAAVQADDTARRAEAEAIEQALLAFVEEQHAVADAQDAAVFADFSARMATLAAEHDRAYADAYFAEFLQEAGLTPADMKRYVETANAALGRLRSASESFATPAVAQEAAPVSTDGSVEVLRVESMSANGVATVPTDDDE